MEPEGNYKTKSIFLKYRNLGSRRNCILIISKTNNPSNLKLKTKKREKLKQNANTSRFKI